jgi:hypothetical protein
VQTQRRHALKIGLLVIPLICGMAVHPGFAKGGKSIGHSYVKSAARPSGTSAKQALHSGNQGPAKTDTAHTTVAHSGDRPSDNDTRITVQPRRLGKSLNPNTGPPAELPFARKPYHPRTLSALPRAPYTAIRNAIGLPISPRELLDRATDRTRMVSALLPPLYRLPFLTPRPVGSSEQAPPCPVLLRIS